jgi:hypothetical protein
MENSKRDVPGDEVEGGKEKGAEEKTKRTPDMLDQIENSIQRSFNILVMNLGGL